MTLKMYDSPIADTTPRPALPTLLNVEAFEPSRYRRSRVLRAAGYEVIEAASAEEALQAATYKRPSIALVEVQLPDSNGIALCDSLKRLIPGLPVLLISASSPTPEVQQAGLAAGAHGYLGGPIASDILVRRVSDALNSGAQRDSDTWVITDGQGFILDASPLGARLLSATPRGLYQRSLLVFFDQDREAWRGAMIRAVHGERMIRSGGLRPKERRPIAIRAEVGLVASDVNPALLWTFHAGID